MALYIAQGACDGLPMKRLLVTCLLMLTTLSLWGCGVLSGWRFGSMPTLPSTWAGDVSCPGCVSRALTLTLFPDGSFHLRDAFTPDKGAQEAFFDTGLWQDLGDRLLLQGANEAQRWFAWRGKSLELLDDQGNTIRSIREYRLTPSIFDPILGPLQSNGVVRIHDGKVRFRECASERDFVLIGLSAVQRQELKQALSLHTRADGMLTTVLAQPQRLLQGGNTQWQWLQPQFQRFWPNQGCATMQRAGVVPLRGVLWELGQLQGKPVSLDRMARRPSLFIESDGRVHGYSGCNRYAGRAKVRGTSLGIQGQAQTRMACLRAEVALMESGWLLALSETTAYRVQGRELVLLKDDDVLAMLSAKAER